MDGGPTMVDRSETACRLGAARADGILDGLDLMACGGVLIDRLGNVLRVNRSAQHQLGCGVLVAHRRLVALDKPANLLLQGLLERALCEETTQGVQGPVALPRPDRLPLIATVAPLPAPPGPDAPPRRPDAPGQGAAAPLGGPSSRSSIRIGGNRSGRCWSACSG